MRNLKCTYIAAVTWKGNTGAGLLANGEENSVAEYINKLCPNFELLEQIFGQRRNINPPVIFQTNEHSDNFINIEDSADNSTYQLDSLSQDDNDCICEPTTSTAEPSLPPERFNFADFKNRLKGKNQQTGKTGSSSSISLLLSLQEKKMDLEVKRFELEKETAIKELELKKIQINQEFELKKLQIEKEERVQRYELELKLKNNQL